MLLKITEKIIRRNAFEEKKKQPGLSANQAFEQLRPVEHLLLSLCRALWRILRAKMENLAG